MYSYIVWWRIQCIVACVFVYCAGLCPAVAFPLNGLRFIPYITYICVLSSTHTHGEQVKMTESTRRTTQRAHALDYVCFTILYSLWNFVVGLFLVRFASIVYYYSVESRQWTNSTRAYRKHRRERPTECVCVLWAE